MDGCLSLRRMENIADWLQQVEDCAGEETCPAKWVPQTQFICVREEDQKVVGVYEKTVHEPKENVRLERYWIDA